MTTIDPRLASIAAGLQARMETEDSLGASFLPLRLLQADAILPDGLPSQTPVGAAMQPHDQAGTAVTESTFTPGVVQKQAPAISPPPRGPTPVKQTQPQQTGDPAKIEALRDTVAQALACTKCRLCERRKQVVFGEGSLDTDLVFLGAAPGREEDVQGRPFAGPAGVMLAGIIEGAFKRSRDSVYICTILKCRPPGNRPSKTDEVEACLPYLEKQLAVIQPKAIVAVGEVVANMLRGQSLPAAQVRGEWFTFAGIPVMPNYDMSYLLRQRRMHGRGNDCDRQTWQNMKKVIKLLAEED